ncbi:prenyltransferase [Nesterenkonia marinintestina]|uniref:prenyltransferase n=1 Tax=Nesterenkonia marinintestina TaxID=2979865 RepID=UPI0021C1DA4B|nr:prenyltransferase [Nesterenkonia sp. GX14115]
MSRSAAPASTAAQLLSASRPVSWINTAYPFGAAYLFGAGQVDWLLVVGAVFFLIPYNLAMYGINDVFDYASDLNNPRKGGIEGAVLPQRLHRTTLLASALSVVPFAVVLAAVSGPATWVLLGISLFAVVAYSAPPMRFKERPYLDSITSSTHFVSPAAVGFVLAADTGGGVPGPTAGLILGAFFLWGMAAHAFGAVQDVEPDRRAGIGSVATATGARRTVRLAVVLWTASGLLALTLPWPGQVAALAVTPYLVLSVPWWSVTDETAHRVNAAWRRFILVNYFAGFLVTMVLILAW